MAFQTRVYQALLLSVLIIAIIYPHLQPTTHSLFHRLSLSPSSAGPSQRLLSKSEHSLRLDYYDRSCADVLKIVNSQVADIVSKDVKAPAQLLRLMFHDCFIQGCDGSILLSNDTATTTERSAKPSETLSGFQFVQQIKEKLERVCPGIVSCSDILVLATRDAMNLTGGPYFTVLMGRKDTRKSHFDLAMAEIPKPDVNISETLRLFGMRHFNSREIVALLGSHNIGKMDCQFITPRFSNFTGTNQTDPTLSADFLAELQAKCRNASFILSGSEFGPRYYQNLVQGRGLIHADQQLMANNDTAELVRAYAADSSGVMFQNDFMKAMHKMAHLQTLTGSQGEVRLACSRINTQVKAKKSGAALQFHINMWKSVVLLSSLWMSKMI